MGVELMLNFYDSEISDRYKLISFHDSDNMAEVVMPVNYFTSVTIPVLVGKTLNSLFTNLFLNQKLFTTGLCCWGFAIDEELWNLSNSEKNKKTFLVKARFMLLKYPETLPEIYSCMQKVDFSSSTIFELRPKAFIVKFLRNWDYVRF